MSKEYQKCIKDAERRKARGKLKLCPRGYCTAKHKFAVYPSAYANGYAVQVCKGEKPDLTGVSALDYRPAVRRKNTWEKKKGLELWFKEKWVDVCTKDKNGNYIPCSNSKNPVPYCRPLHKLPGTRVVTVGEMTKNQVKKMCRTKKKLGLGKRVEALRRG